MIYFDRLRAKRQGQHAAAELVGRSDAIRAVRVALQRVAVTNLPVMIVGERGTGKRLVAELIHTLSPMKNSPFVAVPAVECCDLDNAARLCGYKSGPLPGTLFLHDIGAMSMETQACLLRYMIKREEKTLIDREICQSRLITATSHNIAGLLAFGTFRDDLFFRLNVVTIRLPPLRERMEDIEELAEHFFLLAAYDGLPKKKLAPEALERLHTHKWWGNIRELEKVICRLASFHSSPVVNATLVDAELIEVKPASIESNVRHQQGLACSDALSIDSIIAVARKNEDTLISRGYYIQMMRQVEKPIILAVLKSANGNKDRVAATLGISRKLLKQKMYDLNIYLPSKKPNN